jgi:hypothetical protein
MFSASNTLMARDFIVGGECKDDFCTIFEVEVFNKRAAQSERNPAGVYIHGNGTESEDKMFYGLYIATESMKCRKSAIVPRAVFNAIVGMLETIGKLNASGTPPTAYTPAQQTMLLFYTTIMEQTQNFECNIQGNTLEQPNQ